MIRHIWFPLIIFLALVLQVTVFPAYFSDPFKPNLLICIVVYMGLRESIRWGGALAFGLGLAQDCFSGLYLGLSGFIYLIIFIFLRAVADRLYTDRRSLMILCVFGATICHGLLSLLLLVLFSAAQGVYATLLESLIPQGLMNALLVSVVFTLSSSFESREV